MADLGCVAFDLGSPPEPDPCPDCGGYVVRSTYDPDDPYLWCADCPWQGTDEWGRAVEDLAAAREAREGQAMCSPSFVVARVWNSHGDRDFLAYFVNRWGTACTGLGGAMRFASREAAQAAADAAARLVPALCGGAPVSWAVVEV